MQVERGLGVAADPAEAAAYYAVAAKAGVGAAASNLALMYLEGRGVKENRVLAASWLTLADLAGEPGAAQARNDLLATLSEQERQEATAQALEFMGQ